MYQARTLLEADQRAKEAAGGTGFQEAYGPPEGFPADEVVTKQQQEYARIAAENVVHIAASEQQQPLFRQASVVSTQA